MAAAQYRQVQDTARPTLGEPLVALTGLGESLAKYANMSLITSPYATTSTIRVLALLASYTVQQADCLPIRWK